MSEELHTSSVQTTKMPKQIVALCALWVLFVGNYAVSALAGWRESRTSLTIVDGTVLPDTALLAASIMLGVFALLAVMSGIGLLRHKAWGMTAQT